MIEAFAAAARRSLEAGFRLLEVHAAHGYLLHEFLSPLSNERSDRYGGDFEGRIRLPLEVVAAVREAWPAELPLSVRISASDWVDGGWSLGDSIALAQRLGAAGRRSRRLLLGRQLAGPADRARPRLPGAVLLRHPPRGRHRHRRGRTDHRAAQAEEILLAGDADVILLGRESLRDASWPLRAAVELGVEGDDWPSQYLRARPRLTAPAS